MVACDSARPVCGKTADPFSTLIGLIARRLLLGDIVAAAKYGTGTPIDDPARERHLLAEPRLRLAAVRFE